MYYFRQVVYGLITIVFLCSSVSVAMVTPEEVMPEEVTAVEQLKQLEDKWEQQLTSIVDKKERLISLLEDNQASAVMEEKLLHGIDMLIQTLRDMYALNAAMDDAQQDALLDVYTTMRLFWAVEKSYVKVLRCIRQIATDETDNISGSINEFAHYMCCVEKYLFVIDCSLSTHAIYLENGKEADWYKQLLATYYDMISMYRLINSVKNT